MSVLNEGVIMEKLEKASFLLLDIAGTTTKLDFIKETLFPYFEKELKSYITSNLKNDDVTLAIKQIEEFKSKDLDLEKEDQLQEVIDELIKLTKEDVNSAGVKTIQGMVYAKGYENGNLKGHVFPDVAAALPSWAANKTLCIYSTGSIASQKLLFVNSTEGDLSAHITKYFDQTVGSKTETASYLKIAEELGTKPDDIGFLTDNPKEAKVAHEAGLTAVLVVREGNMAICDEDKATFLTINSFSDLPLSKSKRKIEEVEEIEDPPSKVAKTDEEKPNEETKNVEISTEAETMEVDSGEAKPEEIKPAEVKEAGETTSLETDKKESGELETGKDTKTEEEKVKQLDEENSKVDDSSIISNNMEVDAAASTETEEKQTEVKEPEDLKEEKVEAAKEIEVAKVVEETKTASVVAEKEIEAISDKQSETVETAVKVDENLAKDDTKIDEIKEDKQIEEVTKKEEPKSEEIVQTSESKTDGETKEDNVDKKEIEEKENNGDVANGVSDPEKKENGEKQNGDVKENGNSGEEKDAAEIKVKKIESEEPASELSVEA